MFFLSERTRQISVFELDATIEASGSASELQQNLVPCNGNEGRITRGSDGNFSGSGKIDKIIMAWGNAGTICRK